MIRLFPSPEIRSFKRRIFAVVAYCVMAAATILPALMQLRSTLPTGPTKVVTVPLFNAWTIGWNIDRATHGFSGYWNAPIFHAESGTFAFSEPQPLTLLVAPVFWATGSLIIAYKGYILLSLVLNGIFTCRLCEHLKIGWLWAFAAGAMMVWLPLNLQQMDVLQLIPVWGILWTWDAAWRFSQRPTLRSGGEAAVACGVCFGMSVHHGLFMIVVLLPCLLVTMKWRRIAAAWKSVLVAICLASILVGTLVLPMRRIVEAYQFERSQKLVARLSAKPDQFLRLPSGALLGTPAQGNGYRLSPGWTKLCLAGVGLAALLLRQRKRRWAIFISLMVALSAHLALGPHLTIAGWQPWPSVAEHIPGLRQSRNVFRFFYLTQMGIIVLSAAGLSEIWLRLRRSTGQPRLATVLILTVGAISVCEIPPAAPLLAGVPNLEKHQGWTSFVKQHVPAGKGIACLPFSSGRRVADFAMTTRWMYYGTLHGAPMVNGYSGFFPKAYFSLQESFNKSGLTDALLERFEAAGVDLVVVQRKHQTPQAIARLPLWQYRLELLFSDDAEIDIYRLKRGSRSNEGNAAAEILVSPVNWFLKRMEASMHPSQNEVEAIPKNP